MALHMRLSKPVSRVLYLPVLAGNGDHLSGPDVTIGLKRPTRGQTRLLYPPIRSCSGWGLHGQPVTRLPVSSYLTISPLPRLLGAVCFCCTFRRVTPPGCYPASCPEELGLSSPIAQGGHPVYLARLYSSIEMSNSQTWQIAIARLFLKESRSNLYR